MTDGDAGRVRPYDPTSPKGPLMRVLSATARLRPFTWFLVNVGNRVDPVLMKVSGGRIKTTVVAPTVLLTHRGARSGRERTTPLTYFTDGEDVILIASRGGHEHNPAWYHNVRANPEVELWNGGGGGPYLAAEAEGAERDRLWTLATEYYPGFADYARRAAGRRIPVVVCRPASSK